MHPATSSELRVDFSSTCALRRRAAHDTRADAAAADEEEVGVEARHATHVLVDLQGIAQLVRVVRNPRKD